MNKSLAAAQARIEQTRNTETSTVLLKEKSCDTCNFKVVEPNWGRKFCKHPVVTNLRKSGTGEILEDEVRCYEGRSRYGGKCRPRGKLWYLHPDLGTMPTRLERILHWLKV